MLSRALVLRGQDRQEPFVAMKIASSVAFHAPDPLMLLLTLLLAASAVLLSPTASPALKRANPKEPEGQGTQSCDVELKKKPR